MATTSAIKSRFPDLKFIKPFTVNDHPRYKPFNVTFEPNQTSYLPKGHAKEAGRKKMLVDCTVHRDTAIPLRDGLHVYADIFRPSSSDNVKVPVVICWSPYGKTSINLDLLYHRSGVPRDWTSGYETFEGLDPAEWCKRGYAVVNVDARGSQFSEGTYFWWGDQESEDIYDTIEFLSKQDWCNGSAAMGGNSYLAKAQVAFASRQSHPALKALAPWEGFTDIYRHLLCRGGFAMNSTFGARYQWGIAGPNEMEDMMGMVKSHPNFDEYWAGKYDEVSNINVPLYILGSFGNPFHVYGSFDTFRRAQTKQKWLRVHSSFEWYEMYEPKSIDDLQRFFDRFCKGVMNGWEEDTPALRLSLHGLQSIPNIVERSEKQFPLSRQRLEKFYLNATSHSLGSSPLDVEASVSHEGHGLEATSNFFLKFQEYTEVAGYAKVRLWMSCNEKDDMDVVVQIRKIDSEGQLLAGVNFPCPEPESEIPDGETTKIYGPQGFLRASHRETRDESLCSADGQEIFYKHDAEQKIAPGTIVPLDITLWPMGMVFAPGEGIMLSVAGHFLSAPSAAPLKPTEPEDENVGQHHIHTGGKFDSHLILPIIAGSRS